MNVEDTELEENVPAAGWVAALVGAGLLLGLVAVYDANNLSLGLVIVIYCCVYGGAYVFARWYEARHIRSLQELDPKLAEDWARLYEETLYHVQRLFLIPLVALISIWVGGVVGRAIFGLWSSASTREWVVALTIALVVYVFVVRRRGRDALANAVAGGAAGGARNATYGYFRRRDRVWQVVAVVAVIFVLWMVFFGDDDTSASATETAEAAPTTETISSPLSFGDSGPDVVILQERLAAEGLAVTADGVYGQETADAVMAFQEREQLTVDGVVGSETGEALGIWSG
jgi:hypothetical protein